MIQIDTNLTPENAHEQNFEWVKDLIYDPEAPEIANKDIEKFINQGYKLGQPASRTDDPLCVGLYRSVK